MNKPAPSTVSNDDKQIIAYALRCYAASALGRARTLLIASRGGADLNEINYHIGEAVRACDLAYSPLYNLPRTKD